MCRSRDASDNLPELQRSLPGLGHLTDRAHKPPQIARSPAQGVGGGLVLPDTDIDVVQCSDRANNFNGIVLADVYHALLCMESLQAMEKEPGIEWRALAFWNACARSGA